MASVLARPVSGGGTGASSTTAGVRETACAALANLFLAPSIRANFAKHAASVVPSLLREMLRLGGLRESAPSLRYLHVSGEPLQMALAEQALRGGGGSLWVLNLYGSTECAADVT